MREYELYLIIDADAEEEQVNAIVERITLLITAGFGETPGEMIKLDARGKRRLAYPIKKKTDGLDFVLNFQTPQQALVEIERVLKLDENVLRHLLTRIGE